MNKILTAVAVFFTLTVAPLYAASDVDTPEALFAKTFPQLKVDSITASEIKGLYEVVSGQNIFFFYPEKELLLVGDMYTKAGQNLTGDKKRALKAKQQEKALEKLKELPLDKALRSAMVPKR